MTCREEGIARATSAGIVFWEVGAVGRTLAADVLNDEEAGQAAAGSVD